MPVKMHNFYVPIGGYVNDPARGNQEPRRHRLQAAVSQQQPQLYRVEPPKAPEPTPEEQGFTTKLRLNIPEHFDVGVDKNVSAKDEENIECWRGTGIGRNDQVETRDFKVRPGNVDTDCYFMLIEDKGQNSAMVVPVSKYTMLEPIIKPKNPTSVTEPRATSSKTIMDERLKRLGKFDDITVPEEAPRDGSPQPSSRNKVTKIQWDYDGAPSDDEELYPQEEHEDDGDDPLNQPQLTLYGHKMKTLLQQQIDREVDEELREYSEEDEGSQASSSAKQQRSQEAPEAQPTKKPKMDIDRFQAIEERVLAFLRENNGKVPVKGVLAHFNITAKNDDFRRIQNVIQKKCTMSSEDKDNKKIKFISLKPEFM
ncbi:uncharacterized protein BXIN_0224 [Babesia sp. Xinjiang]|uniref:uncharacterized protein n=1 Tax=Babesia sp. Xinjiang TaxID=462227 RepID=UPI000A21698F|nr:uncharacterized protein BXIN_0224 [Babesia sp. Xinjiang]ORM39865.1 hypothetical protein BXIN_0224 [Babesia sp. Xinjiang]